MENKFVCPECGSELYYWTEEIIERKYKISSKTGKVNKTPFNKQSYGLGNAISSEGLGCSCGWTFNFINLQGNDSNFDLDLLKLIKKE